MGRSFSIPAGGPLPDYYHEASETHYRMVERDSRYYQQRYQAGFDGGETAVEEKSVDYVMGSGNHARTFLHRTRQGTLEELPLGWYAEDGGHWGMNPGYDRPDHPGSRRAIPYECMFCHNAYPQIPAGHDSLEAEPVFAREMPLGIDCQRCHGSGAQHVKMARTPGAKAEDVRRAIINPARLPAERSMEVCMQCHLETTSFLLPHSILRYERGPFSFRPGEALGDFLLFFDHAAGAGRDDKFEIAGAAYRLRQSACFRKSKGALQCTTCHNPHDAAAPKYETACRSCHVAGEHMAQGNCTECHMPKRRTDDVVHAVMTDHWIQRRPAGNLLAEKAELHETAENAYRGPVVPYDAGARDNRLYNAVAQVRLQNNLRSGVSQLAGLLAATPGARAEFYLELGNAWVDSGQPAKAASAYADALRRKPGWLPAMRKLAAAQEAAGKPAEAIATLQQAVQLAPADATCWHELGQLFLRQGRGAEATAALRKALTLDPEIPEAHNSLGVLLAEAGDARAEGEFREAIRISPEYAEARCNLAGMLPDVQAAFEFKRALRMQANYTPGRLAYAQMLSAMRRYDDARQQLDAAIATDPTLAEAHEALGVVWERKGREDLARAQYETAIRLRPGFGRAHLDLAYVLQRNGDDEGAVEHLREAAKDGDATTRGLAVGMLKKLGK